MIRQWSLCVAGVLLGLNAAGVQAQFGARLSATPAVPGSLPGTPERCLELSKLELPELLLLDARAQLAGPFELPAFGPAAAAGTVDLPSFCRVSGVIRPEIRFEVWLPEATNWNGRLQAVGGGGFAGAISYGAMAAALGAGYVTASTDTGHQAPDLEWLSDSRRLRDYGFRAVFEMTAKTKQVINAFYDRPADFNYFNGCSTGGRQGLMEAQRFPKDYDGIVSGAPVNRFVGTSVAHVALALATKSESDESILTADDLAALNGAALAQCDTLDGVADGVIGVPLQCSFDPGVLQCGLNSSAACLDVNQVAAARSLYNGLPDPATGERISHPTLVPGGERDWNIVTTPGLLVLDREFLSRVVFEDTALDWRRFDFTIDTARAIELAGPILDATDPDLSAFRDHGGKLIQYHGWNDAIVLPGDSVAYYEAVDAAMASAPNPGNVGTRDFYRLFMVPGMNHCTGGPGTDQFDRQRAIENWVERGIAPERIEGRHLENGRVTHSRPLCPYPQVARYRGSGDSTSASSFICAR